MQDKETLQVSKCRIDQTLPREDTCDYSVKNVHEDVEVITQDSILSELRLLTVLHVVYSSQ